MSLGLIASGTVTTAAATGDAFRVENKNRNYSVFTLMARGSWGSGTLTVHISVDGTNYFATSHTLTADGYVNVLAWVPYYRVVLTGSTGASVAWDVA